MSSVCSECGSDFIDESDIEAAEPLCADCFETAMEEVKGIYVDSDYIVGSEREFICIDCGDTSTNISPDNPSQCGDCWYEQKELEEDEDYFYDPDEIPF